MRDFQAVFGAFGGGKGQGGGSPEDFRSFFRRFYGLIWVSQKKAARPVLKLRAAVAGAFAGLRPTAGCCMPWAKMLCLPPFVPEGTKQPRNPGRRETSVLEHALNQPGGSQMRKQMRSTFPTPGTEDRSIEGNATRSRGAERP